MTTTTVELRNHAPSFNKAIWEIELMADGDTKLFPFPSDGLSIGATMRVVKVGLDCYHVNAFAPDLDIESKIKVMTRNQAAWHVRNVLRGTTCNNDCPCRHPHIH